MTKMSTMSKLSRVSKLSINNKRIMMDKKHIYSSIVLDNFDNFDNDKSYKKR